MNTATRKAKGKRLQKYVCNLILKFFPILSEKDKKIFPYSIECKNQERMKYLWEAYEQAISNSKKLEPLVIIKINNKKPLVVLDAEYFIKLQSEIKKY